MTDRARRVIALLVLIVGVALVWLLFVNDDGNDSGDSASAQKTVANYSAAELPGAVGAVGNPVYWLGPEPGTQYELTLISDGRTYVRYLPEGVSPDSAEAFTTVGSYAFQDPMAELEKLGRRPGNNTFTVPGGGVGMSPGSPSPNVYVAFPDQNVEIEVFDPDPGDAEQRVKRGELIPIR